MTLVKWNPGTNLNSLENRFNRFFDDTFFPVTRAGEHTGMCDWNPAVDIYENNDNIVIKAELPGLSKKNIDLDVKDGLLTLKGERSHEDEVKTDNYYKRERVFGKFQRVFRLTPDLDIEKIKADFADGVLKIAIPKTEEKKPKTITIH